MIVEPVETPWLLLLLGLIVGLGGMCLHLLRATWRIGKSNRIMQRLVNKRARRLLGSMRMFRMAEELAGLGLWQYYPSGERQRWSRGMKVLFGMEPDEVMEAGDMETLLAANGIDLVEKVMCAEHLRSNQAAEYEIMRLDGQRRTLNIKSSRTRDRKGRTRNFNAVLMDVTDQAERRKALESSCEMAVQEAQAARALAETDPLTGIANRRRVMAELDRLVMNSRRDTDTLALIIFDIDHFKQVNDRYGHLSGDEVLKRIARITCDQARKGDIVGRIGGEEFVWIVPGADPGFARIISERLRQAIAMGSSVGPVPAVTVSVGFASPEAGDTALTLFARADEALYQAKESGRNAVRMAA